MSSEGYGREAVVGGGLLALSELVGGGRKVGQWWSFGG
ncbi:hypothetical protein BVRB_9g209300 [Beta vulgaris subsp. vulgaris]|nr:hypothetical protein BVRB_9g209300 [Beta vulgaris subsp. vulgaris]